MTISAAARPVLMVAVAAMCAACCASGDVSAGSSAPKQSSSEPPIIDFDRYQTVDLTDYATYRSYGGTSAQWRTDDGIRCRIQLSGNNMPGPFGIDCWATDSPAMPAGMNTAGVSIWGYDADDPAKDPGMTPPAHQVFAAFAHLDPAKLYNRYEMQSLDSHPVDPASYHLLGRGQKIVVSRAELSPSRAPGGDPSSTVATCAVDDEGAMTCEQQANGSRHGFFLSSVADAYTW